MESMQAVIRHLVARIREIPLRIPTPEQVLPVADRRQAYTAEATTWGVESPSTTHSYLDDPGETLDPAGDEGRRPRRGRSGRRRAGGLDVVSFPTPRGLLTCRFV